MTKKKRWLFQGLGILLLLGVVSYVITATLALAWRHVALSARTTYIVMPLASDGFPDYLAALNAEAGKGVTNENNAAPVILAIFGPAKHPPAWWNAQITLAHVKSNLPPFVTLHDWLTTHAAPQNVFEEVAEDDAETRIVHATLGRSWSREQYPHVADYLDANKAQIDALVALTKRDHLFLPLITQEGFATTVSRPALLDVHSALGIFRETANAMIQRAQLRLHDGNPSGFREDILAAVRLSFLMVHQHTVFDYLVASAIHQSAMVAIQQASASPFMTDDVAKDIQTSLAVLPEWPAPTESLDIAERYTTLDSVVAIVNIVNHRGTTTGTSSAPPVISIPLLPIHFEHSFIQTNLFFDQYADSLRKSTYADRATGVETVEKEVDSLYPGGIIWGMMHADTVMLRDLIFTGAATLNRSFTTEIAQQRLTQAALALRILHANRGQYPASLGDTGLSLSQRTDPFTEKPMNYRAGSGSYVLYSVGPDLKDNGGKEKQNFMQKTGFDLVVRAPEAPRE
jgi:hypothetical protein